MSPTKPTNVAASVSQKLTDVSNSEAKSFSSS
jgi:hypothetical protein